MSGRSSFPGKVWNLWLVCVRVLSWVLVIVFILMVTVSFLQVVSRYVFNKPLSWSEELSRYLLVWLTFLGSWEAFRRREHIAADLITRSLSEEQRCLVDRIVEIGIFLFFVILILGSPSFLSIVLRQRSAALKIPFFWIYLACPFFALLSILDIVVRWLVRGKIENLKQK